MPMAMLKRAKTKGSSPAAFRSTTSIHTPSRRRAAVMATKRPTAAGDVSFIAGDPSTATDVPAPPDALAVARADDGSQDPHRTDEEQDRRAEHFPPGGDEGS
jgi:hypothetical protein